MARNWYTDDLHTRHSRGEHKLRHPDCPECGGVSRDEVAAFQEALREGGTYLTFEEFCAVLKVLPDHDPNGYARLAWGNFQTLVRLVCNYNPASLAEVLRAAHEKAVPSAL